MLNSLAVCFCSTLWSKISNALKRLGFRSHIRGILGRRALPLVGFVHFAVLRATLPAELCGSLWVRMESTVDAATDCWSGTWTARFRLCLALAIGRWLPFRRHGCHLLCNWPARGRSARSWRPWGHACASSSASRFLSPAHRPRHTPGWFHVCHRLSAHSLTIVVRMPYTTYSRLGGSPLPAFSGQYPCSVKNCSSSLERPSN